MPNKYIHLGNLMDGDTADLEIIVSEDRINFYYPEPIRGMGFDKAQTWELIRVLIECLDELEENE